MKKTVLFMLLLGSYLLTNGQSRLPSLTQPPNAPAFRQALIQQETVRQRAVTQFLRQNPRLRQSFVDKKGAYLFLHHIDPTGRPVYYQTRSNQALATSINTSKLWDGGSLGLNLQGQGMEVSPARSRLGMFEPGPTRTTHQEFGGRAITRDLPVFTDQVAGSKPKEATDHATHVAGTMVARGIQAQARGMANQARLDCYEIATDELVEMQTAASEGMLVSNHSYGPSFDATRVNLGVYDASCQDYDRITSQNKNYLQFHAAGNDRDDANGKTYDILIGGAIGKNVATVGAVKILTGGYSGPASVEIADFSSYGPTDDGRIKPDFVAPGAAIYSAYSGSNTDYAEENGTSMASPGSAGSLFLLQQHYRTTKNGFMRAATLKGLAIHTAEEAGTTPGPDYRFGWGLLNLEKAIGVINQTSGLSTMDEATLANGATYQKRINAKGGLLKVTICWTDVPGTPLVNGGRDNRTALLINDLDLRLINATTNQEITELPWKLDPNNPATGATRGDNLVDNVEQIVIDNVPAGLYYVRVTHKGTLQQGPQEFSVFATGLAPETPIVKVDSSDPDATEGTKPASGRVAGGRVAANGDYDPGVIRFERTNSVGTLVVNYQIGGSATNGVDYEALPTSVTFTDGQSVVLEEMDPLDDDLVEGDETVIITLLDSDDYDPDPAEKATTLTIKDKDVSAPFAITAVTTVACTPVAGNPNQRSLSFTPQYGGTNGQPISFSVVNEMLPTTAPGPYTLGVYIDNPTIQLRASQTGTANEATLAYNWLAACEATTPTPQPDGPFAITAVTTVTCTPVAGDPNRRSLSFTPQYGGTNGQPISFSVVNEMLPTTAPGPYTLGVYIDNPTIQLRATQTGTANKATYTYNWLAACDNNRARPGAEPGSGLEVRLSGNPIVDGQVSVRISGVPGQPLTLTLTDLQGRVIGTHQVPEAQAQERHRFQVNGQRAGLLLLTVSTPTESKTIKVLKAE